MSRTPARATKVSIDWRAVGRRLRELRGFDVTQRDAAQALGISQGQLSRYEKGLSEIGAESLMRIARYYAKSVEWILLGE